MLVACSTTIEDPGPSGTDGGCPVGSAQCPCTNGGACDEGLECDPMLDVCLVPECAIGSSACPCTEQGTCDEGLTCLEDVCVQDTPCNAADVGSEGCQCTSGGSCNPGLECLSDVCVQFPATTSDSGDASSSSSDATGTVDEESG